MLNNGYILQNRYRILSQIGQGGMGAVYLAEDLRLAGRRCAIKESVPNPNEDPKTLQEFYQQFYIEASVLAALDHPNLPKVSDHFRVGDNAYLVMDYVAGKDLQEKLEEHLRQYGAPLPEGEVLSWADQVLGALEFLHSQRPYAIVHRDIKPANLLLTPQGQIKLVDFGLVKLYDPKNPATVSIVSQMGTPQYTPLEQYHYNYGHTDPRSDIYGLGATLYHLLTGNAPPPASQLAIDTALLLAPSQINPKLSPAWNSVLRRAMAVKPNQRFQSASEMRLALAAAFSTGGAAVGAGSATPSSRRAGAGRRLGSKSRGALAALAVALMALLALWFVDARDRSGVAAPAEVTSRADPSLTSVAVVAPLSTTTTDAAVTLRPTFTPTASPIVSPTATSLHAGITRTPTATALPLISPTSTVQTATWTPTGTATPTATHTPTRPSTTIAPVPVTPVPAGLPAPVLVSPVDDTYAGGPPLNFVWTWAGIPLGDNQGFEIRIWRDGQPDHYGAAAVVQEATSLALNPWSAYGVQQGGAGVYNWTVAVVELSPYRQIGPEAPPRTLRVGVLNGAGEDGGGGGSPAPPPVPPVPTPPSPTPPPP